jgi:hypothetical protein
VKFSIRQILASVAGAVIAAVIASSFGVKGTIVGVAIGSAAATIGTALVAQSIERGHEAVKQVVVRAPDSTALMRKLGGTSARGTAASSSVDASSAPTEVVATGGAGDETVEMESTAAPLEGAGRLEISAVADAPATERLQATTTPAPPASPRTRREARRQFSWPVIAGTAAIVFVLALLLIIAIELISGKPLGSIFGNSGNGNIFTPSQTTTTSPTTTTTSTAPSNTTTSTTTSNASTSTTTSTTAPAGSSTTTTSPGTSATTTTGVGASTTVPGATSP